MASRPHESSTSVRSFIVVLALQSCGRGGAPPPAPPSARAEAEFQTGPRVRPDAPGTAPVVAPPAQLMSAATPSEVGVAGVKLLGGGSVLRVGQPRLRTARTAGNLACRTAAGRLFASDRNVVRQWDAVTGVVLSTLRTTWDADISAPMVVASEARHFAVRTGDGAGLGATGAGLFTLRHPLK